MKHVSSIKGETHLKYFKTGSIGEYLGPREVTKRIGEDYKIINLIICIVNLI